MGRRKKVSPNGQASVKRRVRRVPKSKARAQWVQALQPARRGSPPVDLSFQEAWTKDYRQKALWLQVPLKVSSSKLMDAVAVCDGSKPIGLRVKPSNKRSAEFDASSLAMEDVFPEMDAWWLHDFMGLIEKNLLTVEIKKVDDDSVDEEFVLVAGSGAHETGHSGLVWEFGVAWQHYLDVTLYKPAFASPPQVPLHRKMQRVMLWLLKHSRGIPGQWTYPDWATLDALYDTFVGEAPDIEDAIPDAPESSGGSGDPCVEFVGEGPSLGYDPLSGRFLGLL
ncbi:hypothetical protein BBJ28_00005716 [Nothophytophthora sp. Chile5]|nr:hypothetical protein BBJ28_00005716 [Nothophytophthora sp. Chile5]